MLKKNVIAYVTGKAFSKIVLVVISEHDSNDKLSFNIDTRLPRKVFDVNAKI